MSQLITGLLVLDTCALAHYARQNSTGRLIEQRVQLSTSPEKPILPSVVEGELRWLARLWAWGPKKMAILEDIIGQLVRIDVGEPEIVKAYSELYYAGQCDGKPCGENDIWIAATAMAAHAQVLTCDSDFKWLDPHFITVHYIETIK